MPDDELGPAVRRRMLSRQLKELRLKSQVNTLKKAAARSGLSDATISRIETGDQVILPRNVQLLCDAYGVGQPLRDHLVRLAKEAEERGWLLEYAATVPNWFSRYVSEEADADGIWTYMGECIPGLFQTETYMRGLMAAARFGPDAESFDTSVAFRRRRQKRITEDDKLPQVVAVMSESAVHRLVGGVDVMAEQLRHIIELAKRPNITVQILPFEAGAHPAMIHGFTVLNFPPIAGEPTIYVEIYGGALYPDRPDDYDLYLWKWEQLRAIALSPEDSVGLLTTLVEKLDPGE